MMNILKVWSAKLGKPQSLEGSYNMLKTIEAEHARIHQGTAYGFSEKLVIEPGSAHSYIIDTGSEDIHFRSYQFNSTLGPCDVHLYEAPFFDAASDGTAKFGKNRNRTFSDSSALTLYSQPFVNVASLGEHIDYSLIQATGSTKESSGGSAEAPSGEFNLHPAKQYLLQITNNNVAQITVGYDAFWYQEN